MPNPIISLGGERSFREGRAQGVSGDGDGTDDYDDDNAMQ